MILGRETVGFKFTPPNTPYTAPGLGAPDTPRVPGRVAFGAPATISAGWVPFMMPTPTETPNESPLLAPTISALGGVCGLVMSMTGLEGVVELPYISPLN